MTPPIIQFDYDQSPYSQKTRLILHASSLPFSTCPQPALLPRPDLLSLGITYRRVPLLAIGKDIYCDTSAITAAILSLPSAAPLRTSPLSDRAFQDWGDATFQECLALVPPGMLKPEFIKDRETVFPILKRKDLHTLRPSAMAGFRERLVQVERGFLKAEEEGRSEGGVFVGGKKKVSLADINIGWVVKWAMKRIVGDEAKAFGKEVFPRVWRLLESLPEVKWKEVGIEEAKKVILGDEGTGEVRGPTEILEDDPLGIKQGTVVSVESFDSEPGAHPQVGKLIASSVDEVVLGLDNGIRLHFPRLGYIVRPQ